MALRLITAPEETPVTLAEARAHLNLLAGEKLEDNTLIQFYLDAATSHIDGKDGWLQRALKPQTWELIWDAFPSDVIQIPLPPLVSIVSITYVDADGATQTIDAANYVVDSESVPGWVAPIEGYSWPTTLVVLNAVRVRFVAGYADSDPVSGESEGETPSNVPPAIKAAILLILGDWYEHRETVGANTNEISMAAPVKSLLFPYKFFTLA